MRRWLAIFVVVIVLAFASPPTSSPTKTPTNAPTHAPTPLPTTDPTRNPTTRHPTHSPTTRKPSRNPTENPTTVNPSENPTENPTTSNPSENPTTINPTFNPTRNPTAFPTSLESCTDEDPLPTCNDHGNCKQPRSEFEKTCECEAGFFGDRCEIRCETSPEAKNAAFYCRNGTCTDNTVRNSVCKCNPNYYGVGCKVMCNEALCNGHGTCVEVDSDGYTAGSCNCTGSFRGEHCEKDCATISCNGHGECSANNNDKCTCYDEWKGENCTECSDGYSFSCLVDDWNLTIARNCCTPITLNPSPYPCDRSTCNNHGNCSYADEMSTKERECICDADFKGTRCESCKNPSKTYESNCTCEKGKLCCNDLQNCSSCHDLEWAKQCSWAPNQNVCVRGSSDPNYSCDVEAEDQDISDDVPSVYIILGAFGFGFVVCFLHRWQKQKKRGRKQNQREAKRHASPVQSRQLEMDIMNNFSQMNDNETFMGDLDAEYSYLDEADKSFVHE